MAFIGDIWGFEEMVIVSVKYKTTPEVLWNYQKYKDFYAWKLCFYLLS